MSFNLVSTQQAIVCRVGNVHRLAAFSIQFPPLVAIRWALRKECVRVFWPLKVEYTEMCRIVLPLVYNRENVDSAGRGIVSK